MKKQATKKNPIHDPFADRPGLSIRWLMAGLCVVGLFVLVVVL